MLRNFLLLIFHLVCCSDDAEFLITEEDTIYFMVLCPYANTDCEENGQSTSE